MVIARYSDKPMLSCLPVCLSVWL